MMKQKELTIVTPIGDWEAEHRQEEPEIRSADDLISMRLQGIHPAKIARLAIVARELGVAPDDILPANKLLLNTGAALEVTTVIAQRKRKIETDDGKEIEVREFVAPVREEGDQVMSDTQVLQVSPSPLPDDNALVTVLSESAHIRALDYLLKVVPGYVYGRLAIIAVNGGDVAAAGQALKDKIDELVERLG